MDYNIILLVSRGGTWMTDINIRINEFEQLINLIQTEKRNEYKSDIKKFNSMEYILRYN